MNTGEKLIPVYYKTKNRGILRFDSKEKINEDFTNCGTFSIYPDEKFRMLQGRLYKCKQVIKKKLKLSSHIELNASLMDKNDKVIFTTGCAPMKDNKFGVSRSLVYGPDAPESDNSSDNIYGGTEWEFISFDTLCKDLYLYDNIDKIIVW